MILYSKNKKIKRNNYLIKNILTVFCYLYTVAPKIDRKNLTKKEIRRGKFLKFEADIEGEPAPTVSWSFNGQPILFNDRYYKITHLEYFYSIFQY